MPLPCLTKHRARTHSANSRKTEKRKRRKVCVLGGGSKKKEQGTRWGNMEMQKENNHALCFPLCPNLFFSSSSLGFYCYYHGSAIRELYVLLHWSNKWRGPHSFFLLPLLSHPFFRSPLVSFLTSHTFLLNYFPNSSPLFSSSIFVKFTSPYFVCPNFNFLSFLFNTVSSFLLYCHLVSMHIMMFS